MNRRKSGVFYHVNQEVPYLPSSISWMFSGRQMLSVSGRMKTRLPLTMPVPAKMSGGRRSHTSSSSMIIGARELPIRQRHEV